MLDICVIYAAAKWRCSRLRWLNENQIFYKVGCIDGENEFSGTYQTAHNSIFCPDGTLTSLFTLPENQQEKNERRLEDPLFTSALRCCFSSTLVPLREKWSENVSGNLLSFFSCGPPLSLFSCRPLLSLFSCGPPLSLFSYNPSPQKHSFNTIGHIPKILL